MSSSRTDLLYSGGLPAATISQSSGSGTLPKVLFCSSCRMTGLSVSDTQLISSRNSMPLRLPVRSMASYTAATISLIVYSVTARSVPP